MSFRLDDDDILRVRPHRHGRGAGRSGAGRRLIRPSFQSKWNFAEGSRAAVFKRIGRGGTHDRSQLRRQMDYINKKAHYSFGYSEHLTDDRKQPKDSLDAMADKWEAGWNGTPKNGHSSHLLFSFPPDTAPRTVALIAEDLCERAFGGEKHFADDRWEYVAALHTDREHPHVHVIVNNRGVERGSWFYLSADPAAPFTYQGFRDLMVAIASDYGVQLEATTRYARGDLTYSPSSAQWRQGRAPGLRALSPRVMESLIEDAEDWADVAKAANQVGNARVAEVAGLMIDGIAMQRPLSREDLSMGLAEAKTPEDFETTVNNWVDSTRDAVLSLPLDKQGKHFRAMNELLDDMASSFGFARDTQDISHPGPIGDSLHADLQLLRARAVDYHPGSNIGLEPDDDRWDESFDQTMDRAVEMFSAGVTTDQDLARRAYDFEMRDMRRLGHDRESIAGLLPEIERAAKHREPAYRAALDAVERAHEDYSYESRPGDVAAFWKGFDRLTRQAGVDRDPARDVLENDLLNDERKLYVLKTAVDPQARPSLTAEQMFHGIQDARDELRANVMIPDSQYLGRFLNDLTERDYPTSAPNFANVESEKEFTAALRAAFGRAGLERISVGDYRDLEAITPNRLNQREIASAIMATAERPSNAEKLGLSRAQIAAGYDAADEPHKAQRVLGQTSTGDDFSL